MLLYLDLNLLPKTTSDVGGLQDDYGFMPLHYVVEPKFLDTDHDFSHIESQDITDILHVQLVFFKNRKILSYVWLDVFF